MTELDKGQGDLSGNRAEAEAAPAVDPPPQEQEEANQPAEGKHRRQMNCQRSQLRMFSY